MWVVAWGILMRCPELRTKVSAAGPKADGARPRTAMGGGIFLRKLNLSALNNSCVAAILQLLSARGREEGGTD